MISYRPDNSDEGYLLLLASPEIKAPDAQRPAENGQQLTEPSTGKLLTVFGGPLGIRGLDLRTGQQEQVALVALVRPVADHTGPELTLGTSKNKRKSVSGTWFGRCRRLSPVRIRPLDVDRMCGAVDVFDFDRAFDRRLQFDLLDRFGGVLRRAEREQEIGQRARFGSNWL